MRYKLLTGDNIDGLGWTLSDALKSLGARVIRCSNSLSALEAGCAEHKPDALIFFITVVRDELFIFAEKMVAQYPKMKIFVLSYVKSYGLRRRLEDIGITNYFLMPDLLSEICKYIIVDLLPEDEQELTFDIISYLESKGIQRKNAGFYYFCTAIKISLLKPELLVPMTLRFYPYIAYLFDTSELSVEPRLRRFSSSIAEDGVRFARYKGEYPINNANLISLAADEFAELYDLSKY